MVGSVKACRPHLVAMMWSSKPFLQENSLVTVSRALSQIDLLVFNIYLAASELS